MLSTGRRRRSAGGIITRKNCCCALAAGEILVFMGILAYFRGGLSFQTVADYLRREQIDTIHSTEPDLETVFMELTGRRIDQ